MANQITTTVKLNSGYDMPKFGLGTWKSQGDSVTKAVIEAIDLGYRHFDTAYLYENEKEVGDGIKDRIDAGKVKREDLFITTKLWNTFHSPHLVVPALKDSLKNLQIDFLDMYLIHWPMGYLEGGELCPKDEEGKIIFSDVDYLDTWKALEECVNLGLTKSIGLSNFNREQVERIWENSSIKPSNLQVECHPYLNQVKLLKYCQSKGIVMTGYSPFGSPDRPWAKPEDPKLLDDPKIIKLASKYDKKPAQIVLRWQLERGIVVIPKTVTKSRLIENMSIFDFTIDDEDVKEIESFDVNGRNVHFSWVNHHKYYPFNAEF